jgi:hypothetical protein
MRRAQEGRDRKVFVMGDWGWAFHGRVHWRILPVWLAAASAVRVRSFGTAARIALDAPDQQVS